MGMKVPNDHELIRAADILLDVLRECGSPGVRLLDRLEAEEAAA